MTVVPLHEADLGDLLARAEAGEDIVISRGAQPVARLTAIAPATATPADAEANLAAKPRKRVFGAMKGQLPPIPKAFFFDPLPDEELRLWWGKVLKILLDSHTFVWFASGDRLLSRQAREAIEGADIVDLSAVGPRLLW